MGTLLFLLACALAAGGFSFFAWRQASLEASLPLSAPPPRAWERPLIWWGEALQDAHSWWAYTCVDCKQNFGSAQGLTQHIISRAYCTVGPALPLSQEGGIPGESQE